MSLRSRPRSRPVRIATLDAGGGGERRDGIEMLAGENLGRRHECGLAAAFDHRGARQQSDHGLARSYIALQQPQHALGPGKIGDDFSQGACLRRREGIGQGVDQRFAHMSGALRRPASGSPQVRTHQRERQLARQQLVIGEPRPRQTFG